MRGIIDLDPKDVLVFCDTFGVYYMLDGELRVRYKIASWNRTIVRKPNPILAVARGHLTVTLPVVVVIVLAGFIGKSLAGTGGLLIGIVIGAVVAWPCWSFLLPRWRDWVEGKGLAPEDVQSLAASTGLLWPRGSFLERTEFRRKGGKRGW